MALEVTLKVDLDGDIRRLPLPNCPESTDIDAAETLADVRATICTGFGIEEEEAQHLLLRYADDEGDLCTLVESTLSDALKLAAGAGGTLKLQAKGQKTRQRLAAAPGTPGGSKVAASSGKGKGERSEKGKGKGESRGKDKGVRKGKSAEEADELEFSADVPVDEHNIDTAFGFRGRIIGQGAKNVRHIREQTGALVWLKGKGSKFGEPETGRESEEPLHLHISSSSQASLDRAVALANDLLGSILDEYDHWVVGGSGAEDSYGSGKGYGKSKGKGKGKYSSKSKGSSYYSHEDDAPSYKRPRTW